MKTIFGTIVAIIAAIALSILLGPYSAIVILVIIFGLIFSMHQRNKEIYEDIQRIKEKLGIIDINEFDLKNEDIEKELEDEHLKENESI